MKHKLQIADLMRAKCSCGQWEYVGITAEASASIKKIYQYHYALDVPVKKTKKRK
jgi:hypothetical protein